MSLIVVRVTPVASCNVSPSLYGENRAHYSVVVYARPFLFVNLATIREHFVLQRCVGQLLLVLGGLPGGPPLIPDIVEKKKSLY